MAGACRLERYSWPIPSLRESAARLWHSQQGRRPLLVVVTDGRATAGPDAVNRSRQAARLLAGQGVAAVVVDCETGTFRMGLAGQLASHLLAEHVPMAEVSADDLTRVTRDGHAA